MNGRNKKLKAEHLDIHEDQMDNSPLNIIKITKSEIIISYKNHLTFYENMKEKNKIELEHEIGDMICLNDKSIALSCLSEIKILKKNKDIYEIYKTIEIETYFLLNIDNNLYSFNSMDIHVINLKNFSTISTIQISDQGSKLLNFFNEVFNVRMKPFILKYKNKCMICMRKSYTLFFMDVKDYKIKNQLSFDDAIEFTVYQKNINQFYVCILKDINLKINLMEIDIKEYNDKLQNIKNYKKKLIIPPITETLYPYHICIEKLLLINNQFYLFTHLLGEFDRNGYKSYILINFENNKIINVLQKFYGDFDDKLGYNFLLDENNKLIYAYNDDKEESGGIKFLDYENYESESDSDNENYEENDSDDDKDNEEEQNSNNEDNEEDQESDDENDLESNDIIDDSCQKKDEDAKGYKK